MEYTECRDCGKIYNQNLSVCPRCGSIHKRTFLELEGAAVISIDADVIGMQGRVNSHPGRRKVRWEWKSQEERRNDGTLVKLYRAIDRENDSYEERVTNIETGEVIHECMEPLSKHRGHGCDKKNKEK